jgi:hypothetical protein
MVMHLSRLFDKFKKPRQWEPEEIAVSQPIDDGLDGIVRMWLCGPWTLFLLTAEGRGARRNTGRYYLLRAAPSIRGVGNRWAPTDLSDGGAFHGYISGSQAVYGGRFASANDPGIDAAVDRFVRDPANAQPMWDRD